MEIQLPLFSPKADWVTPIKLPYIPKDQAVAIDLETRDPNLDARGCGAVRGDGYVVGIAIGWVDGQVYLPLRHEGGVNMEVEPVIQFLRDTVDRAAVVIFANAGYDLEWMRYGLGVEVRKPIDDVNLLDPLIDEELSSYSLDSIAYRRIGRKKDELLLRMAAQAYGVDPKADLWKLPAKYVGAYAEQDVRITWDTRAEQRKIILEKDLTRIARLETDLIKPMFEMRCLGIRIDVEKTLRLKQEMKIRSQQIQRDIDEAAGKEINVWSGESLASACDILSIPYGRTPGTPFKPEGSPSFTRAFLESTDDTFLRSVAELREVSKLLRDFVGKLPDWAYRGRIHPSWHQLTSDEGGTRTGRMACSKPNIQQVPARSPLWGKRIRELFIPDEGLKWAKMDYSQQEPRILVHYGLKTHGEGVERLADAYFTDPAADVYKTIASVAGVDRRQAKTITLGFIYGMGLDKLADQLGVSLVRAQEIKDAFDEAVPFVSQLAKDVMDKAMKKGEIRTLGGRVRHFDWWRPRQSVKMPVKGHKEAMKEFDTKVVFREYTYKALNSLVQGSAADQTKAAMLSIYQQDGKIPYLAAHDELGYGVVDMSEALHLKSRAEKAMPLLVPMVAEVELKDSW